MILTITDTEVYIALTLTMVMVVIMDLDIALSVTGCPTSIITPIIPTIIQGMTSIFLLQDGTDTVP